MATTNSPECPVCHGLGLIWYRIALSEDSDVLGPAETCDECDGAGVAEDLSDDGGGAA